MASQTLKTSPEDTLWLPGKLRYAVKWLIATIDGECGPGKEFEVPLRHLILKGGRGSGKSHSVARILVQIGVLRAVRMLCTRETQKSIEESVYQLLIDTIAELEYESLYNMKKTTIELTEEQYFFLKEKALERQRQKQNGSIVSIIRDLIDKARQEWNQQLIDNPGHHGSNK